jgi:hypothetical protein
LRPVIGHDAAQAARAGMVAAAGLAVVLLWGLYGDLFLSNLVVVFVIELMLVILVPVLVAVVANLVRDYDRWQVESALTFRQMLSENKGASVSFQAGSPFHHRQLELRLSDDIKRSRDYGLPVALLAVRLELKGHSPSHAVFVSTNMEVAALANAHRDLLATLTPVGMFEYVLWLPGHDGKAAMNVARFLERELKRYQCTFGLAVCPEDGTDADDLLRDAVRQSGAIRHSAA